MGIAQALFSILALCIVGAVTIFIIKLLNKKSEKVNARIKNETIKKYNEILDKTIQECVISTNQTFVNALKEQDKFDIEAQKEAFNRTYQNVLHILTQEAADQLNNIYDDLDAYITTKIESEVGANRLEN